MGNLIFMLAIIVLITGLFILLTSNNYVRKIIGLGVFQSSTLIFYIALNKVAEGVPPIELCEDAATCSNIYSSPLPHVLMLTAIVVGFATMSVGLALVLQIKKHYSTVLESQVNEMIRKKEMR
jgi:multicomponent Na+:H+ antiporter subunit C